MLYAPNVRKIKRAGIRNGAVDSTYKQVLMLDRRTENILVFYHHWGK